MRRRPPAPANHPGPTLRTPHARWLVRVSLVHDGVAAAAGDRPTVDRERGAEGDQERDTEAPPEERIVEPRCDGAGDEENERVVDDLHGRDRERVRSKG